MSQHTKLLLLRAEQIRMAKEILAPYVKHEEYAAYMTGWLDAIALLQDYDEKQVTRGDKHV